MKSIILLLVTVFLINCNRSTFDQPIFLELQKTPFGQAVTSLLKMHAQATDPSGRLDAINSVIDSVEESLQNQSKVSKEWITKNQELCQNDQSYYEERILEYTQNIKDLLAEITLLQTEQSEKDGDLLEYQQSLEEAKTKLKETNEQLESENLKFEQTRKDFEEAVDACEKSLKLLYQISQQSVSFIQLGSTSSKLQGVKNLLQQRLAGHQSQVVKALLNILTEMSSNGQQIDQVKLNKIVQLIEQLLAELRKQLQEVIENHESSLKNFNNVLEATQKQIDNSSEQIEILTNRLSFIGQRLEYLQDQLQHNNVLKESQEKLYKEKVKLCNDDDANYRKDQSQRDQQLDALNKIRLYFRNEIVPAVENIDNDQYEDQLSQ